MLWICILSARQKAWDWCLILSETCIVYCIIIIRSSNLVSYITTC